jgi:hypothetical protein
MSSRNVPATPERSRELAVRYENSIMRLGFLTTTVWVTVGLGVFLFVMRLAFHAGLSGWVGLLGGAVAVAGVRQLTVQLYRQVRDRLRRRRLEALAASAGIDDLGHLTAAWRGLVMDLRSLVQQIHAVDENPGATIDTLGRWLVRLGALEHSDRQRVVELGLDASPLHPLASLRREQGELTDFWNERAYRRLQQALPVLGHRSNLKLTRRFSHSTDCTTEHPRLAPVLTERCPGATANDQAHPSAPSTRGIRASMRHDAHRHHIDSTPRSMIGDDPKPPERCE